MKNYIPAGLSACVLVAGQTWAAGAARIDDSSFYLEEVVVTAKHVGTLPTTAVLTSVDIAGSSLVQDANVAYAWELFGRMPGVILTEFNQGTTSGKLSFRGFNGEGEVNAAKLLIDGVPSNSNDGNMPYIDTVFPLGIDRIEVVRGTNDPRYGLHSIGGNANIVTRQGGSYQEARIGYGSWNTRDLQAAAGYQHNNLSQNYLLGYRASDGYRDHADNERYAFSGKWFYDVGANTRAAVSARIYKNKADEPGYLTQTQVDADPQQSPAHSVSDGGDRRINQLSVHLETLLGETLTWNSFVYRNRLDDQRFVKFSAGVSQQERDTDETQYGFKSAMTFRPQVQSWSEVSAEWGIDAEWQKNISERYLSAERIRTSQTRNQHFTFNVYGAYAQAVLRPVDWLKLVPGWRIDKLNGHFDNQLSGVQASMYNYGYISQPKISAVVSLGSHYSAYANWGRTYQVGVTAASYKIPPLTNELEPSRNTGWEVGMKFVPTSWLNGRVSYWRQSASNEWQRILNSPNGDSENIGSTQRKGYDLQVNVLPATDWKLWMAYSHQVARIVTPGTTALNTLGREIDHIPHQLYSGGVNWQTTSQLNLSLELKGQSDYYLERTNSQGKFGDFVRLNLSAQYQVNKLLALEAQIKNLTDRYSEYVWWDGAQSLHAAADARAWYLAAKFTF